MKKSIVVYQALSLSQDECFYIRKFGKIIARFSRYDLALDFFKACKKEIYGWKEPVTASSMRENLDQLIQACEDWLLSEFPTRLEIAQENKGAFETLKRAYIYDIERIFTKKEATYE